MLSVDRCVPVAPFDRRHGTPVRGQTAPAAAAAPRLFPGHLSVAASYQMKLQTPLRCSTCGPQSNHFHCRSDSPAAAAPAAAPAHHSTPDYKAHSLLFNYPSISPSSPLHRLHRHQPPQQHHQNCQRHQQQQQQRWDAPPLFNSPPLTHQRSSPAELPSHHNQRGRREDSPLRPAAAACQFAFRNSGGSFSPENASHHYFPKVIADVKKRYLALGRIAFNEHRGRVRKELEELEELDKNSKSPIALITVTKRPVLKSALQKRNLGDSNNRLPRISKSVRFSEMSSVLTFSTHSRPSKLAPERQVQRLQAVAVDSDAVTQRHQYRRHGSPVPPLSWALPVSLRSRRSQNQIQRGTSVVPTPVVPDNLRSLWRGFKSPVAAASDHPSSPSQDTPPAAKTSVALNFQVTELKGNDRKENENKTLRARGSASSRNRSYPGQAARRTSGWAAAAGNIESGDEPEASKRRSPARSRAGSASPMQMMHLGTSSIT